MRQRDQITLKEISHVILGQAAYATLEEVVQLLIADRSGFVSVQKEKKGARGLLIS